MEYTTVRQHFAGRKYAVGDRRTANPEDVAPLVSSGVLVADEAPKPRKKKKAGKGDT